MAGGEVGAVFGAHRTPIMTLTCLFNCMRCLVPVMAPRLLGRQLLNRDRPTVDPKANKISELVKRIPPLSSSRSRGVPCIKGCPDNHHSAHRNTRQAAIQHRIHTRFHDWAGNGLFMETPSPLATLLCLGNHRRRQGSCAPGRRSDNGAYRVETAIGPRAKAKLRKAQSRL